MHAVHPIEDSSSCDADAVRRMTCMMTPLLTRADVLPYLVVRRKTVRGAATPATPRSKRGTRKTIHRNEAASARLFGHAVGDVDVDPTHAVVRYTQDSRKYGCLQRHRSTTNARSRDDRPSRLLAGPRPSLDFFSVPNKPPRRRDTRRGDEAIPGFLSFPEMQKKEGKARRASRRR